MSRPDPIKISYLHIRLTERKTKGNNTTLGQRVEKYPPDTVI